MSKARGVTMPRAIVPYICKLATATTSPRARFVLMHGQVWKRPGATAGWDAGGPGEGLL